MIIAMYTRSGYPSSNVKKYETDYSQTNINTLILSGPNGYNGGIVYNDSPYEMFNAQGSYVGDSTWASTLIEFASSKNITNIYFSLSNSAISALANMTPNGLESVMNWLKHNKISGIDMDCEYWGQPGGLKPTSPDVETVTLAAIAAGLKLTAAPYNLMDEWKQWCQYVSSKSGNVEWLNLQCYVGGYGNNPVEWAEQFPNIPIVPGIEPINSSTDTGQYTPQEALTLFTNWHHDAISKSLTLGGGFLWDFGFFLSLKNYTITDYTEAIITANTVTMANIVTEANTVITSTKVTIKANTSFYGNFPVTGGNLLSVGFQNMGFRTKIYPTQLMIDSATNVFFQIDNLNSDAVDIYIWGIADNPNAKFGSISSSGTIPM